jgi:uncharacterized protein (DUF1499 family)
MLLLFKKLILHKVSTLGIFFFIFVNGCSGTKPLSIGQFSKCPDKPNCISSKSSHSQHIIPPLKYQGTKLDAKKNILKILKTMPRAKLSANTNKFIHIEFTSKIFRFVDDVEFYFDEPGVIHFRSASRVGYSDMGVNKNRMEEIERLFIQASKSNK